MATDGARTGAASGGAAVGAGVATAGAAARSGAGPTSGTVTVAGFGVVARTLASGLSKVIWNVLSWAGRSTTSRVAEPSSLVWASGPRLNVQVVPSADCVPSACVVQSEVGRTDQAPADAAPQGLVAGQATIAALASKDPLGTWRVNAGLSSSAVRS